MEYAVLHYPNAADAPAGIWWWDGGSAELGKFYVDEAMEMVGTETMGPVAMRADEFDPQLFFADLAARNPRPDLWATITLYDATGPEHLMRERDMWMRATTVYPDPA